MRNYDSMVDTTRGMFLKSMKTTELSGIFELIKLKKITDGDDKESKLFRINNIK